MTLWVLTLVIAIISLTITFILTGGASAQTGPYMSDLPAIYPVAYRIWAQSLPYALGSLPEWLSSLKGVVSPIRDVSVNGSQMKFGTTCMHDCGDNIAGVLFDARQTRVVAVVRLKGRNQAPNIIVVNQMSSSEFSCIQRLVTDHQSVMC
jgi:Inhibitor of vertebrate lysozyme (Ivy)